jgi:hypothetical protein
MKELEQVAKTFTSLAQLYMVSGNWKPAYKTGDLYKNIGSYNTPSRMITSRPARSVTKFKIPQKSFNVSLQFAPNIKGSKTGKPTTYGKWVEWGNDTGVGAGNPRPFAEKASQDPLLKKTIDAYVNGYMEKDFLPVIKIGLDRAFRSLSAERAKAR